MTDLQQLIEKYKKEITQLEAQIVEMKRRQGILIEASILLQEEALAPHKTLYEQASDGRQEKP